MTSHENCSHPKTKGARAACRKARSERVLIVKLSDAEPFTATLIHESNADHLYVKDSRGRKMLVPKWCVTEKESS